MSIKAVNFRFFWNIADDVVKYIGNMILIRIRLDDVMSLLTSYHNNLC